MPDAIVLVERRHSFPGRGFLLRCHTLVEYSSKCSWMVLLPFEEGDANADDDGHKACGKEGKQNDHLKLKRLFFLGHVVLASAYLGLIFANVGSSFCVIY